MALQAGVRLGPYEVLSVLGAGGMGEVYLARDTRLDRRVAIKVLPSELSSNAGLKQRFDREARTLSSLTHPHICALHDIGSQNGIDFLVMEYLEGETLSERLQRSRRLSIDEALTIAIQIAAALDTAHRRGVVHRDVKPGNIMLTKTGAKLLDFGLAKNAQPVLALHGHSAATTATPITAEGTILGTLPYMAPEQLEGREADGRTDIFAFGSVLYEMATGRRAFEGKSQVSLMAAIVEHHPPPVSSLAPLSPGWLDDVVKACLEKDPDKRWQSTADILIQLRLIAERAKTAVPPPTTRRSRLAWVMAAVLAVGAIIGVPAALRRPAPSTPPEAHFDLEPPNTATPYQIAFSPSGRYLVTTAVEKGVPKLWFRAMDNPTGQMLQSARALPGTTGASCPTWSPDERFLAFVVDGKLKKLDVAGGQVMTLADAPGGRGVTWNRDGVVVFAPRSDGALVRVAATGGAATPLTELDTARGEIAHRHPFFLPDGNHFIYLAVSDRPGQSAIHLASLDRPKGSVLVHTPTRAAFALGHLLFVRSSDSITAGTLMSQRLDLSRARLDGEPVPIAENIGINVNNGAAAFTASHHGLLAHRGVAFTAAIGTVKWFDRTGRSRPVFGSTGEYVSPRISPDGRFAVVGNIVRTANEVDLWMLDLERGTGSRFTSSTGSENLPVWSPDSIRVIFNSTRAGGTGIYVKDASGVSEETALLRTEGNTAPEAWSPDGRFLLYRRNDPKTLFDIWSLPLIGDRKEEPLIRTPYAEQHARFSPDGRWVAYQSNESGRDETYLVAFPKTTIRIPISTAGGREPKWRGDGKELFYAVPDGEATAVMAVDIDLAEPLRPRVGVPRKLFTVNAVGSWDVAKDGGRFLMVVPIDESEAAKQPPLRVIINWQPR